MNDSSPLRVTLVDDNELSVAGLTALMKSYEGRITLVETRDAIAHPDDLDVVLYEPMGQSSMSQSMLRDLQAKGGATAAVFTWASPDEMPATSTSPYLSKSLTASQLVVSLERLAEGRFEDSPAAAEAARAHVEPEPVVEPEPASRPGESVGLTPREAEIISLIVAGMSNREIGETLTLSINSVKTYIRSAYRKMGVERRTQAVLWGLAQGMRAELEPALVS
ncbi:MAG: helix-turn-helix transcriptional regulator [Nocardioides sp.]|nr:helix-turn-helix transcriptional regulator [Nocardioides sp.]